MQTVLERENDFAEAVPCIHCGELTPQTSGETDEVFCCHGCAGAYRLIHGLGLDNYYSVRDRLPTQQPDILDSDNHELTDEDCLDDIEQDSIGNGQVHVTLAVQGLHCGACSWLIENALQKQPGVQNVHVHMNNHSLELNYRPEAIRLSAVSRLMRKLGYRLAPLGETQDSHLASENIQHLTRIAVSGFLAANAMWIAIALYAGATAEFAYFLGLTGTALSLIALVGPGRIFLVGALAALRTRTPHMDLPVALGLLAGSLVGTYNAVVGIGHVYFDSIAALVFLLSIGRWLQFRQQQRAAKAVELLLRITPQFASRIEADGSRKRVPVSNLKAQDTIEVLGGQCVPADGSISGCSDTPMLDCSLLTGESESVKLAIGQPVAAGTINAGPPILVNVLATGKETRIGQVMASVEEAVRRKTPIVMLADRVGGYFVVIVSALAIGTFTYWLSSGFDIAVANASSLLIVACPCALALATPLAIAVGLGRAAKRGILIRDGSVFQHLAGSGTVWLDKTGTLTEGKQRVTSVMGDPKFIAAAATIELECIHPIARAIENKAKQQGARLLRTAQDISKCSNGIQGRVDSQNIAVGNLPFMRDHMIDVPESFISAREQLLAKGESPIYIAADGQVVTLLGISDPIRAEAFTAVESLKKRGWSVGILSGDHTQIVNRVGKALGIAAENCLGDLSPKQKLEMVEQTGKDSTVLMVGDGANDAAALATADVGIAVRGGAEVSLQAAPVFLSGGPRDLNAILLASSRVQQTIFLTFFVSLSYNLLAVGLAMAGFINPLIAAVLMPISSLSVLGLTLSKRTFRKELER